MTGARSIRRGPAPTWLVAGYAGLAGFVVLEATVRQGGGASTLDDSDDDRGTTRLIAVAYGVAAALPPLLRPWGERRLSAAAGPVGLAVEASGLGLRLWSMRTLRASYSRTLRTTDEQAVVDRGPYRLVRHPGYLGSVLTWTGCALASGSVPTMAAVVLLLATAYRRRIAVEEELLGRELPAYADYAARTKRLVPFVW